MTESHSESSAGLLAILVLSVVLVSSLLVWHPWSNDANAWTTTAPQQPAITPDESLPVTVPHTAPASSSDSVLT